MSEKFYYWWDRREVLQDRLLSGAEEHVDKYSILPRSCEVDAAKKDKSLRNATEITIDFLKRNKGWLFILCNEVGFLQSIAWMTATAAILNLNRQKPPVPMLTSFGELVRLVVESNPEPEFSSAPNTNILYKLGRSGILVVQNMLQPVQGFQKCEASIYTLLEGRSKAKLPTLFLGLSDTAKTEAIERKLTGLYGSYTASLVMQKSKLMMISRKRSREPIPVLEM